MDERTLRQLNLVRQFEDRKASKSTGASADKLPAIGTLSQEDAFQKITEWLDRSSTHIDPSLEKLAQQATPAFERAALSGKFDPQELIPGTSGTGDHQAILSMVAKYCQVESVDKVLWCLQQKKRNEVLAKMIGDQTIHSKVREPLPGTDMTGNMLRRIIISGNTLALDSLSQEELRSCLLALELTKGLTFNKPDEDEVKKFIKSADALDNYNIVTSGFIGREKELKTLHEFIGKPIGHNWEGIIVTGLGGAGKSTLVAKFMEDVIRQKKATAVILDFDRPGIDPKDTFWLDLEISRQIGAQYPKFEKELSDSRRELRNIRENDPEFADFSSDFSSTVQESARFSKSIISSIGPLLFKSRYSNRPFLIVLDTIEEPVQRMLIYKLEDWINTLESILSPIKIKVIFSGRLFDSSLQSIKNLRQVMESIELEEFDPQIARKFLSQNKMKDQDIEQVIISKVVPLRPLELKLVAKLLEDGSLKIEDLLSDLSSEKSSDRTDGLFTGIIYRRVLLRIGDPVARELACPGLVLRYLTAQLILEVLAPALQLPIKDIYEATKILNELTTYNWLCYTDGSATPQRIWHRKDLRRSMLSFMIAKESEKVRAIREKAITFFNKVGTEEASAESIYHRLMQVSSFNANNYIELNDLNKASSFIMTHIADLPRQAEILMKFATNQSINETEAMLLPDPYFEKTYLSTGRRLVATREFLSAYTLFKRGQEISYRNTYLGEGLLDRWEKELLYSVVEWDAIKRLATYQRSDPSRTEELSLLVNYIFPAALINPGDVHRQELTELVFTIMKGLINKSKKVKNPADLFGPDTTQLLYRLSHSLVLLAANDKLSPDLIDICKMIYDIPGMDNEAGSIGRSLLLVYMVGYKKLPTQYLLSTHLIKLDPEWLSSIQKYTADREDSILGRVQSVISGKITASSVHSKLWLSDIDGARVKASSSQRKIKINFRKIPPGEAIKFIQGPVSIFRDPCRYAILEAFPDEASYMELAAAIQAVIKVQLTDLEPTMFTATMLNNAESGLETFIEIIDRSWTMGNFLNNTSALRPNAAKLKLVRDAHQRWENAFQLLCKSATEQNK